jgi:glucosamine--fructose-6-phosphate aminotransferase (isomerizing)
MCGITAGISKASDITVKLLSQLKNLEYRGYDSAGIALVSPENELIIKHTLGEIESLNLTPNKKNYHLGIAHTRWATHGQVTLNNAHPHHANNRIALVHNGIIENHESLRKDLNLPDNTWRSETDSEVIVHLINQQLISGATISIAIEKAISMLKGTYALAVIDKEQPNRIYCVAHQSSLIIGRSTDGFSICSDQNAITDDCDQACQVINDVVFSISPNSIEPATVSSKLQWKTLQKPIQKQTVKNNQTITYQEINQQGYVMRHLADHHLGPNNKIINAPLGLTQTLAGCKRVLILACGSSYYCALTGRYWLERIAGIPTSVELASEYRYRTPVIEDHTLIITLSQSGETLDTISALKYIMERNSEIQSLCVGNNTLSSLAQLSTHFWDTQAGPEVGVATTKVFTAQLFCLGCITALLTNQKEEHQSVIESLKQIPAWISGALETGQTFEKIATQFISDETMLFCARNESFPVAQEAALKIKELAYIHAQGYAAGELKHGPLALIEPRLTTVFFISESQQLNKVRSNISEVIARKGKVLIIGSKSAIHSFAHLDNPQVQTLTLTDKEPPALAIPFVHTIGAQFLAFFVAQHKGCAIDKPRNLAKCVTVE